MPNYGRPPRAVVSSPVPSIRPPPDAPIHVPDEENLRKMRLKVLYTFDDDKTNCLARWPHALDIRTAQLDSATQVGVIELKTCLQAIASASPEIVAGLGQDYTVYAYDYSEYETPLVGQGMLSWILASASPTPGAPAHQSRTMVTGRVSKNGLGLFGSNIQEMLEVKLRLVPVPTSRQNDYIESMKKYRDVSEMMPAGYDPQTLINFLQQHAPRTDQAILNEQASQSHNPGGYGLANVQRLFSGEQNMQVSRPQLSRSGSVAEIEPSNPYFRAASPASSIASSVTAPKRRGRKPGPNYRGPRTRAAPQKKQQRTVPESTDPGYGTADERIDDGNAKKRAKVVQTEWDGRPEIGKQQDSLRVAASTAASIRILQPTAIRPGINAHLELDNQPRAPTPVSGQNQSAWRPRSLTQSGLARSSLSGEPISMNNAVFSPTEDSEYSPGRSHAGSSPVDISSSPPAFLDAATCPTSPQLPLFSRSHEDATFTSANFDALFAGESLQPTPNAQHTDKLVSQNATERQYKAVDSDMTNHPVIMDLTMADTPNQSDEKSTLKPYLNRSSSMYTSRSQIPASDPIKPSDLQRSNSWTGRIDQAGQQTGSTCTDRENNPLESESSINAKDARSSDSGGQSGIKRKALIQSKLASSIASGEMPSFCDNCGAIETPTWRKAWAKVHSGTPESIKLSQDDGGVLAWQTLRTDNKGVICLYRIIKKSLVKGDEGFAEVLLCNPCGMYLYTRKCMRPKEMWDHKATKGNEGHRRHKSNAKTQLLAERSQLRQTSGISTRPSSEPSSPGKIIQNAGHGLENEPQLPAVRRRRMSHIENKSPQRKVTLDATAAAAALEKAIQSSPLHKKHTTPRHISNTQELTPKPTRRLLFPSPTKSSDGGNHPPSEVRKDLTPRQNDASAPQISKDDIDMFFSEDAYAMAVAAAERPNDMDNSKAKFATPAEVFSAAKMLLSPPARRQNSPGRKDVIHTTPKKTNLNALASHEMTPFTANLTQLFSDAHADGAGILDGSNFDFSSLPSLRNTPRSKRIENQFLMDLDFGELGDSERFDSQDLISTDIPMPSSPPPWNFGAYVNINHEDGQGSKGHQDEMWSKLALQLPRNGHGKCDDQDRLVIESQVQKPQLQLRRSPRAHSRIKDVDEEALNGTRLTVA